MRSVPQETPCFRKPRIGCSGLGREPGCCGCRRPRPGTLPELCTALRCSATAHSKKPGLGSQWGTSQNGCADSFGVPVNQLPKGFPPNKKTLNQAPGCVSKSHFCSVPKGGVNQKPGAPCFTRATGWAIHLSIVHQHLS